MGGTTAEDPVATRSVSYFSVFRLDSFTVRALPSTRTAATPVRIVVFICLAYSGARMFMPGTLTVPSRKWVSPTRE
jgi:hypothetical protein